MQHLAQHVEMNLRGLMLSFRLLLGSNVAQQELSQHWHSSLSGVDYTVGMIWARLSETAPHQMGAVQSLVFPTQYAAALEPAQQVKGLLGFFISHNSLVSSKAQQQGQGLLPPDQGLHSDWLKAACAAADAIRLLHDAFTTKSCLSLTKQGGSWLCCLLFATPLYSNCCQLMFPCFYSPKHSAVPSPGLSSDQLACAALHSRCCEA
jgi:hypothetical protein